MSDLAFQYHAEASEINEASAAAIALIQEYSEMDPAAQVWRQPTEIYQKLDVARCRLTNAWTRLEMAAKGGSNDAPARSENKEDEEKKEYEEGGIPEDALVAAYMDMITDAFGDVLEDMRTNQTEGDESLDVDVLVDCLQSGLDIMTQEDKEFLFHHEWKDDEENNNTNVDWSLDDEEKSAEPLSPHEERRQALGFNIDSTES